MFDKIRFVSTCRIGTRLYAATADLFAFRRSEVSDVSIAQYLRTENRIRPNTRVFHVNKNKIH